MLLEKDITKIQETENYKVFVANFAMAKNTLPELLDESDSIQAFEIYLENQLYSKKSD